MVCERSFGRRVAYSSLVDLTESYLKAVPERVRSRYEFFETRNAAALLRATNHAAFVDLMVVLDEFELLTSDLLTPGGQESALAGRLNRAFRERGWREARVDTNFKLLLQRLPYGGESREAPWETEVHNEGYHVDNFRDRVALDVEWNAKDGNLDRDIGAYRALYDAGLIDLAVMVTRTQTDLRALARRLALESGRPDAEARKILGTTTTTNTDKLRPKMTRGDSGGCPLLAVAICEKTWAPNRLAPTGPLDLGLAV